jgi:hypothetical protein
MKKCFFFCPKHIIPFFCLWAVTLLMLLVQRQAWSQTLNPAPVAVSILAPIPPPELLRNLPWQTTNTVIGGNQPPAAVPQAAGPMNYGRTYTPRIGITFLPGMLSFSKLVLPEKKYTK